MSTTDEVLSAIDGALDDWTVGPDAMRQGAPRDAVRRHDAEMSAALGQRVANFTIRIDTSGFVKAMRRVGKALVNLNRTLAERRVARLPYRERRRLGYPHDAHHPKPLAIDGHEYARRRKARR